jgi:NTE family protein
MGFALRRAQRLDTIQPVTLPGWRFAVVPFTWKAHDDAGTGCGPMKLADPSLEAPKRRRPARPIIGLALGGGAARGWAHIGVLQELDAQGIRPDIIAGTSVGAVAGGCYAAGKLIELEAFSRSLTKSRVFTLMDLSFSGGGLIGGGRLKSRLESELASLSIEGLKLKFAAVATEIGSGHEIWLTRGSLVDAIRASYALPGIFEPVQHGGRWLFDGALVNPIPVSVCRALGASYVIAVNLNADTLSKGTVIHDHGLDELEAAAPVPDMPAELEAGLDQLEVQARRSSLLGGLKSTRRMLGRSFARGDLRRQFVRREDGAPGIASVMIDAFNITQDRISRSRLAGDPPDLLINAKVGRIGLFEFHRAGELIVAGKLAARRALSEVHDHIAAVAAGEEV